MTCDLDIWYVGRSGPI